MTLSINEAQNNQSSLSSSAIILSVVKLAVAIPFIVDLNVAMLCVIMLNAVILNVVAPLKSLEICGQTYLVNWIFQKCRKTTIKMFLKL